MDIKPVLSKHPPIKYLLKYLTKNDPATSTLKEFTQWLLHRQTQQCGEQQVLTLKS